MNTGTVKKALTASAVFGIFVLLFTQGIHAQLPPRHRPPFGHFQGRNYECGTFDPNGNGVNWEVSDVVLYGNCLLHGRDGFPPHVWDSILMRSDYNCTGIQPRVTKLVYAIRVVVGDALPYPRPTNLTAAVSTDNGLSIEGVELGAVLVVLKGQIEPVFLNGDVTNSYYFDGTNTHVLISSPYGLNDAGMGNMIGFTGELFENSIGIDIISIEMADVHGFPVALALPTDHVLNQNYPNPFNATTTISFGIPNAGPYQITIHNSLGQTVKTISGNAAAGIVKVLWDAGDLPSGVYFYRLETPQFTETKKAVLIK